MLPGSLLHPVLQAGHEKGGRSYLFCRLQAKDYIGKWVVLFFYPKDFTFVCPTEIIAFSDAAAAFAEKNCAVIGASTDSAEVHLAWINTPRKKGGLGQMKIPLLADVTRRISKAYGVLGAGVVLPCFILFVANARRCTFCSQERACFCCFCSQCCCSSRRFSDSPC